MCRIWQVIRGGMGRCRACRRLAGREIVSAEIQGGKQDQNEEHRPDHYFSVITASTPVAPARKCEHCHAIQLSYGASRASASNIACAAGSCAFNLAKAAR